MKVPADLVLAEVSCALQVAAFSLCAYVSEGALNSHMGLKGCHANSSNPERSMAAHPPALFSQFNCAESAKRKNVRFNAGFGQLLEEQIKWHLLKNAAEFLTR